MTRQKCLKYLLVVLICLSPPMVYAGDINVSVAEVKDSRTTGQFFAEMELKLKIMGDSIADSKGVKVKIAKAFDDTGRDLLKSEAGKAEFTKPNEDNPGQVEVSVKLKNPARKATVIKEMRGEIVLLVPKKDPDSTAIIKNFMMQTGKKLSNASLKSSGVEVTVLTKAQYEQYKAAKAKEMKEKEQDMAKEFGEAVVKAFSSLLGGMMEIGENSIIFEVEDPGSKVAAIEFADKDGKAMANMGSMRMGAVYVFEFQQPMPEDAQMTVFLVTPKSLITTPLIMVDIALP